MQAIIGILVLIVATLPAVAAFATTYRSQNTCVIITTKSIPTTSQLNLFGNNNNNNNKAADGKKFKKVTTPAPTKLTNKPVPKKKTTIVSSSNNNKKQQEAAEKKDKEPLWKKAGRMAVTGSMDGVSLLGKPQYDWSTGKPMSRPKAFDWSASYKKKDNSTIKGKK